MVGVRERMKMKRIVTIAALAALTCHAFAGVNVLTSRPAGADDLDWAQLGPAGTVSPSGTIVTTTGSPFQVKVSSDRDLTRYTQSGGWAGNFAAGDELITNVDYTNGSGSYIELLGMKTCIDMGANIQSDYYGDYVARISAYDGLDNLLGSFTVSGTSNSNGDGSAVFLGVHSDIGDIHRVVYSLDSANGPGFALNHVTYNCCAPVPEPASMTILGLGAAALLRRKGKKA